MNTSPASNIISLLQERAAMLRCARAFFHARHVMEVDCPALSCAAPIDLHIDVMRVHLLKSRIGYLHTSPEYGMKQLLSLGSGDIYQISHVFRDEEISPLHHPEFTMAEWYRIGFSFEQMIEETLDFIRLFLGELKSQSMTYRELLKKFLDIDYLFASCAELVECGKKHGHELGADWDKDTLLQALISLIIEPKLALDHLKDHLFVVTHFPASQAALAKTTIIRGEKIAYRFEVYYKGIELANGYHELSDPQEQRERLMGANAARMEAGKSTLPLDESFLSALTRGLPDCCGVAVGFDRLLQLKTGVQDIRAIMPSPEQWGSAFPP